MSLPPVATFFDTEAMKATFPKLLEFYVFDKFSADDGKVTVM